MSGKGIDTTLNYRWRDRIPTGRQRPAELRAECEMAPELLRTGIM